MNKQYELVPVTTPPTEDDFYLCFENELLVNPSMMPLYANEPFPFPNTYKFWLRPIPEAEHNGGNKQTAFLIIPVDNMPEERGRPYFVLTDKMEMKTAIPDDKGKWFGSQLLKKEKVTHWLKPVEGYFFTEAELLEQKKKDQEEGWNAATAWYQDQWTKEPLSKSPNKETYLSTLTIDN
jgi:hypothetical protein